MTEQQRFLFDLRGWILLPGILSDAVTSEVRRYLEGVIARRAAFGSAFVRQSLWGPAQELLDHPAIIDVLRDVIAPDTGADAYGFRCESGFFIERRYGQKGFQPPHTGPLTEPFLYRVNSRQIWSGLTRVVWEINGVSQREGGTAIVSGSHKSRFPLPDDMREYDPRLFDGYTCPPGSALVFTENCWHYGVERKDPVVPRLAIFNCYSSFLTQWHRLSVDPTLVEQMPRKRQSLFRGVWGRDVRNQQDNTFYSRDNTTC
jgi:hypothetical protein